MQKQITRQDLTILFVVATALSVGSFLYFYLNDLTLIYNDARSHLNIARRVFDSLTPGLTQLGSVWLPLPHILALPFIWNDFLFHSGIAGSIVSMIAYIFSCVLIFLTIFQLAGNKMGALVGFLIFALNPNILYLQSTPMTESLFLVFMIASIYFFVRWMNDRTVPDLLMSAMLVMFSTLVRYDGWFLLIIEVCAMFIFLFFRNRLYKKAEGSILLFSILGGFGVMLWFFYNSLVFGDWLYSINGEYSASAQQKLIESTGKLPTKHDIFLSIYTYFADVASNVGLYLSVGIIVLFIAWLIYKRSLLLTLITIIIFSPVIFNIVTLFLGMTVIYLPGISSPDKIFNVRYGIMILPAIATAGGLMFPRKYKKILFSFLVILISLQYGTISRNDIITISDGLRGNSAFDLKKGQEKTRREIANIIIREYEDGLILMSVVGNDPIIFEIVSRINIRMHNFIHEGNNKYWKESLTNPNKYADMIVIRKDDGGVLNRNLTENNLLKMHFDKIFEDNFMYIYKIKTKPEIDLLEKLGKK